MSGSARKSDKPQPSYVDGKVRDPQIEALQKQVAKEGDQKRSLRALIRRAVRPAGS